MRIFMTTSEKYSMLKRACDEKKVCEIKYTDNRPPRAIHPLGMCLTSKRGLVIVCCFQNGNGLKKWQSTVMSLPIEDCDHVKILDEQFQVRPGFVASSTICLDWLFQVK
jgi:hypothetical protein